MRQPQRLWPAFALLAASLLAACETATRPVGTYVALGDSLAAGVGVPTPAELGYVPIYFDTLRGGSPDEDFVLRNLAVSGETSHSLLSGGQLEAADAAIADPDTDVRVVSLGIGGNDLLALLRETSCATSPTGSDCQSLIGTALAGLARNLTAILTRLNSALAADPGTESVLVMTYYNPFSGTGSRFETPVDLVLLGVDQAVDCTVLANPVNVGLNDLIACATTQAGATVVDAYPAFQGRGPELTNILEGDVHPNTAGYREMARLLGPSARTAD